MVIVRAADARAPALAPALEDPITKNLRKQSPHRCSLREIKTSRLALETEARGPGTQTRTLVGQSRVAICHKHSNPKCRDSFGCWERLWAERPSIQTSHREIVYNIRVMVILHS
jgi:hypothetical protein